MNNLFKICP